MNISLAGGSPVSTAVPPRPPGWLFAATAVLTVLVLAMAVAETNLWMHYLIDGGEFVSLLGLAFIAVAGVYLYQRGHLLASLPLVFPWLLFPLITQGDQIIDHLSINPMRFVTHLLLAAIFATPVAVVVLAARHALPSGRIAPHSPILNVLPGLRLLAQGRMREGTAFLGAALFVLQMWIAVVWLGTLMIVTLIVLAMAMLWYGSSPASHPVTRTRRRGYGERFALAVLLGGVVLSLGLYFALKNRPGAYQGSPSHYLDPSQQGAGYDLTRIQVPSAPPATPSQPEQVRAAFATYGRSIERLLSGYYILDRNYTWDFHNELFLRSTPLLPNYRAAALARIEEARQLRAEAEQNAVAARATLGAGSPLAAALDEVRAFVAFNFDRAAVLEEMSAGFERTKAGLQHAAHLYEGEGKIVSEQLAALLTKHRAVLESPATAPVTAEFARIGTAIQTAYANRVVGF